MSEEVDQRITELQEENQRLRGCLDKWIEEGSQVQAAFRDETGVINDQRISDLVRYLCRKIASANRIATQAQESECRWKEKLEACRDTYRGPVAVDEKMVTAAIRAFGNRVEPIDVSIRNALVAALADAEKARS